MLLYAKQHRATGYRVGPVYASKPDLSIDLIKSLCSGLPKGAVVYMDIPKANTQKQTFIESLKLKSIDFECMRMYKATAPSVNLDEIYAVASIEMG